MRRRGAALEIGSAKARALFFYLVMTGRTHTRAALAGLLWGEQDEAAARANLRRALMDLGAIDLGAMDPGAAAGPFLDLAGQTVALRRDCPLWIDAIEFAAQITAALPQTAGQAAGDAPPGTDAAQAQTLSQAVALYAGDFLEGFYVRHAPEFEAWMLAERVRLRALLLQALETLAQHAARQGDLGQAIGHLQRLLALEPWREEAHRQVMVWLAQSGQRSAALAQYETCRRALAAELDVTPAPETVQLHAQIRSGDWPPAPAPRAADVPRAPGQAPAQRIPTNLPVLRDRLIGRERELAEVSAWLLRDEVGLMTLTGPGGVGKTRLALAAGATLLQPRPVEAGAAVPPFADGVWLVDLAALTDAELVPAAVAQVLKVRGERGQGLAERLQDELRDKRLLLILDNFEHLTAAAPSLAQILSAAPGVKALVTSRVTLRLRHERVHAVPPLAVPASHSLSSLTEALRAPAVMLFLERARAILPDLAVTPADLAAIAEICVRLDGLPLALELAAARIKLLPPPALLARLQHRLQILTGGPRDLPTRQQTLRATIDWSYQLLEPGERQLLARLAVFAGGGTLEAAEAVCAAGSHLPFPVLDGLHSLVDKSMVELHRGDEDAPRLRMLESIREYALERLEAHPEEAAQVWRAYAGYFLGLAEAFRAGADHITAAALDRLERELDNFRAVLGWAIAGQATALGLRLAWALHLFWFMRGEAREERVWLRHLLDLTADTTGNSTDRNSADGEERELRAKALLVAGSLAAKEGDLPEARRLLEAGHQVLRQAGQRDELLMSLRLLGYMLYEQGHYAAARTLFDEALAITQAAAYAPGTADALCGLGWVALMEGEWPAAQTHFAQALALSTAPPRPARSAESLAGLGFLAVMQQDYAAAHAHFVRGLAVARTLEHKLWTLVVLAGLGIVHVQQGAYTAARALFREGLAISRAAGEQWRATYILIGLCVLAAHTEQPAQALCLAAAVTALREATGAPLSPLERHLLALGVPHAQAALDAPAAEAARAQGQAMSWEQVIRYAVADDPPAADGAPRPA